MNRMVAYYRVSTKKQGESGLGLEAQRATLEAYVRRQGGELVGEYTEVESGKHDNRPALARAIEHARAVKGCLVVAKLDRLARNVLFTAKLLESQVEFVACDMPNASRVVIQIMAAIAEGEAKAISERTRAALAAAKAAGKQLGSARLGHWDGREDRRRAGQVKGLPLARAARSQAAADYYRPLVEVIREQRERGATLAEIAAYFNEKGYVTRERHLPFSPARIRDLIQRYLPLDVVEKKRICA